MKIKYIFAVSCAVLLSFAVPEVQAASLHRVAGQAEYQEGSMQNSPVIKKLNRDLEDGNLDDYEMTPVQGISDPLEPWNRFWFGFNDIFYLYVASPLYSAYDFVIPDEVQGGLSNFFNNLLFPVRFVNALLQGKVQLAGVEFSRFLVNSTVGMGGFIDVAKHKKTVVPYTREGEDFGQTLATWGVGEGFYLVLPILGPSSARGAVGTAVDYFIDPALYLDPTFTTAFMYAGFEFNDLDNVLPLYKDSKAASVDPYIAMREAYAAYRKQQILH